jgi:hypothetical protein
VTLQRLIAFSASAYMACSSVAFAAVASVSPEVAQTLADKITKEILSAATQTQTLEIQGKVEVTPQNDAYVFTIPPVRGSDQKSAGVVILTNKISGRFTPTEQTDVYNFQAKIDSPAVKILDPEGQSTFEAAVGAHSLTGMWNAAQESSYTAVFDAKDVAFNVPDPSVALQTPGAESSRMISAATVSALKASLVTAPQASSATRLDGRVDFSMNGLKVSPPQESEVITLDQLSFGYTYQGYDASIYNKTMAEWNGQIPLDFSVQMASKIAKATEGTAKGSFSLRGLKIESSQGVGQAEAWSLAQSSGSVAAKINDNLLDGTLMFSHDGLAVPMSAPVAYEFLPKTGNLNLSFDALRFDAVVKSILDATSGTPSSSRAMPEPENASSRIPQIKLNDLSLKAPNLSAAASGVMRVEKNSPVGLVGEINAHLTGLDEAAARITTYTKTSDGLQDSSAQMMLIALSTANVMGQSQQGQSGKSYTFAIDNSGTFLLNGSPMASFAPQSALPATQAPTPLVPPQ